jgi:hypothetical protein
MEGLKAWRTCGVWPCPEAWIGMLEVEEELKRRVRTFKKGKRNATVKANWIQH